MSSSTESLVLKLRPDLSWSQYGLETEAQNRANWVVCDPIALEYFYFSDVERKALVLLDGVRNLSTVLETEIGRTIGQTRLIGLISRARAAGLLISHQSHDLAESIWKKSQRLQAMGRLQWLLSPLSFRFRLFDPTALLSVLSPVANLLFRQPIRWMLALAVPFLTILVVARLLAEGTTRTIYLHATSSSGQVFALVLVYLLLKSLHELGHALACKKWGAQCHEIGLIFLVFAPCLYCDTSDSWRISNHRNRAWIAAAGIYVELMISVGAACIWLVTLPTGQLHWLAAYAMIVGSISTVVVNANPLLRYDGYYLMCDLMGIPNLAEQSREGFESAIVSFFSGAPIWRESWDKPLWFLCVYELLAKSYRMFLTIVIIGFVWTMMNQLGIRFIGFGITLMAVLTYGIGTLRSTWSLLRKILSYGGLRVFRSLAFLLVLAGILWSAINVKWATFVSTRSISELSSVVPLYTRQTGHLVSFPNPGSIVKHGDPVIRLSSSNLQHQRTDAIGQMTQAKERLQRLRLSQVDNPEVAGELGTAAEHLATLELQVQYFESEILSLTISSPADGRFLWSDIQSAPAITEATNKGMWSPLLAGKNTGCWVERGSLLGWIATDNKYHVVAFVTEQDAKVIQLGAKSICKWDCAPHSSFDGVVSRISTEPIPEPSLLAGDSSFLAYVGFGTHATRQRLYEVEIQIEHWPLEASNYSLVTTHISTGERTLVESLHRYFVLNVRPFFENKRSF